MAGGLRRHRDAPSEPDSARAVRARPPGHPRSSRLRTPGTRGSRSRARQPARGPCIRERSRSRTPPGDRRRCRGGREGAGLHAHQEMGRQHLQRQDDGPHDRFPIQRPRRHAHGRHDEQKPPRTGAQVAAHVSCDALAVASGTGPAGPLRGPTRRPPLPRGPARGPQRRRSGLPRPR